MNRRFQIWALLCSLLFTPLAAQAATFVVNTTVDNPDVTPGDGLCRDGLGTCSFRAAIQEANALVGLDRIHFSIGSGPVTIVPTAPLSTIREAVIIAGTTQPGYQGSPIVEINSGGGPLLAHGLRITGHDSLITGLVINRCQVGVLIEQGASGNTIQSCYIGTDSSGTTARPNDVGIRIRGAVRNIIGGLIPPERNLVSGNLFGIDLVVGANENTVIGNYIGTDASGQSALGNRNGGIGIYRSGSNWITGNLISGNGLEGVSILDSALNRLHGNIIGLNAHRTESLPNGSHGVIIAQEISGSTDNEVGGVVVGTGNFIAANLGQGVFIAGSNTTGNRVLGNYIGTNSSRLADLGNTANGVFITDDASRNEVRLNAIAFNGGSGILIGSGRRNTILDNAIFENDGLGIDLAPGGPSPNDEDDSDTGANDLQNFPVLTAAFLDWQGVHLEGVLRSLPDKPFLLQFFASEQSDATGFGEGATLLGSASATTDFGGAVSFAIALGHIAAAGQSITTAATDLLAGNTSEFSEAISLECRHVFPDVPCVHWAWRFIEAIFRSGIAEGFEDGTYRPDVKVSRGQMAVFMARAADLVLGDFTTFEAPDCNDETFTDVPCDHFAYQFVEYIVSKGIASGFGDGAYKPDRTVSRDAMAVFLARVRNLVDGDFEGFTVPDCGAETFTDVDCNYWAYKFIEYVVSKGITAGFGDGTYRPNNIVTRAQMAVFVTRVLQLAF